MFVRFLILALLTPVWAWSALAPVQPNWIRSRSGQFVVESWTPDVKPVLSTGAVDRLRLQPMLLAVSCDRIRNALLQEMRWGDEWKSAISLNIRPYATADEPVRILAVRFTDGWGYRVELPPEVTEDRLIRAIVEVLLSERAQRRAALRSVEVPRWLVEGLAEHLHARALGKLVLESDLQEFGDQRRGDPFQSVRQLFQASPPLPMERLAWPVQTDLRGPGADLYQASAHVLVYELLQLRHGQEMLGNMVDLLPEYLNWQTAFLRAFHDRFTDFTDFDKWWSLLSVHYSGHPERFHWSNHQSLRQLDEILTIPLDVRLNADQLPMRTRVNVQKILLEWDYNRQDEFLMLKLNHLQALLLRCHPDQIELVRAYSQVLGRYIQERRQIFLVNAMPKNSSGRAAALESIRQLNQLDEQRRAQTLQQSVQVRR